MSDFENLIAQAKKRGISVILDLPFNDTSVEHPWFKKALVGDKKYMAYYNWSDTAKQGYALASNGKYYEAEFDKGMPDLNLANPDVKAELAKITKFWLDKGVSGFRLDAVYYYFQNDDQKKQLLLQSGWLTQSSHKIIRHMWLVKSIQIRLILIQSIIQGLIPCSIFRCH
nr:alpha-amylase family glycosyl hydrolase [Lactococcus fujiensis]